MTLSELQKRLERNCNLVGGQVALSVKFLTSQKQININEKLQLWAASVIKVPIACEFFRQYNEHKFDYNARTKLTDENLVLGTGVLKLLDRDDALTYLDLVKLMLVLSDNAATNQIVDLIGWESIEKYMVELGLEYTTFRHKMMIKAGRGPNLTTSGDVLRLFEKLYKKELPQSDLLISILNEQYDRSRIPLYLPNNIAVAHKLGSLPEAVHDAGIVFGDNPFIFVFLSDDQKDKVLTTKILAESAKLCFDYANTNKSTL